MSKKTIIVAGVAVLICVACFLITSLPPYLAGRASNYGVTEPGKSALVIKNKTTDFYILDVSISGDGNLEWHQLVSKGAQRVFAIDPGKYTVSVHYSDKPDLSNLSFMTWYVSANKQAEFEVKKGRSVVFVLQGGDTMGMMYDPPDLITE